MSVRAKFRCFAVTHGQGLPPDQTMANVTLMPVWADGEGNKSCSKATPNGRIEMTITNPSAVEAFEPGKEYFVDFTPAA